MFLARRIVDPEAAAQRIERCRRAGKPPARQGKRIGHPVPLEGGKADAAQFEVEELDVEGRVVDHQPRIADKVQKGLADGGKDRVPAQELLGQSVHGKGFGRHVALRVDVLVIDPPGRHVVVKLDRADFHDPVAFGGLQPGGFGIENDFTHPPAPP